MRKILKFGDNFGGHWREVIWRFKSLMLEIHSCISKFASLLKNVADWAIYSHIFNFIDLQNSTQDLVAYAAELNPPRPVMLLVNKSDFLTDHQRYVL